MLRELNSLQRQVFVQFLLSHGVPTSDKIHITLQQQVFIDFMPSHGVSCVERSRNITSDKM